MGDTHRKHETAEEYYAAATDYEWETATIGGVPVQAARLAWPEHD